MHNRVSAPDGALPAHPGGAIAPTPHRRGLAQQLRLAAQRFWRPLEDDRRHALQRHWESLDPRFRTPYQAFGRKMTGCCATIGLHPRCDFACVGCYLGEEANKIPPLPLDAVMRQLEEIRAWTGPKGNVQLTDGEVTLRPVEDLIALIERCHALELIPMLMTHGDGFRRKPGLLETLARAGLTEVSIHIDTTMRGRIGYKQASDERELMPLRDEFAAMLRQVNRAVGRRQLRAAHTMTITQDNLPGLAAVTRWCADNRDAFKLLSLQPLADVGRTQKGLRGVTPDACWEQVARGLAPFGVDVGPGGPIHVGHPECNRVASFLCIERPGSGSPMRMLKTIRAGSDDDREFMEALDRTGLMGVGYRLDAPLVGLARKFGAALHAAPFVLGAGQRWLRRRLRDVGESASGLLWGALRGRVRFDGFTVVSHHFMGRDEVQTSLGQERLAHCVFKLPVGGEMLSMCEVNLLGARAQMYAAMRPGSGVGESV